MKSNNTIKKQSILFIGCFLVLNCAALFPQQSNLSKSVNQISSYISSEEFISLKNEIGDIAAVDSIYEFALEINEYDHSETLLSLMFATVPYKKVPLETPLFHFKLFFPLISADDSTFNFKNKNLPKYLFFDTPQNDYGDKDKLAHFFGSAFLSYSSCIFDLGTLIGYFVEAFEESFKVQSEISYRDLDVNDYGNLFGKMLKENCELLPSQIILFRSLKKFSLNL